MVVEPWPELHSAQSDYQTVIVKQLRIRQAERPSFAHRDDAPDLKRHVGAAADEAGPPVALQDSHSLT